VPSDEILARRRPDRVAVVPSQRDLLSGSDSMSVLEAPPDERHWRARRRGLQRCLCPANRAIANSKEVVLGLGFRV
jgi:hypothetical protein